MSRFKKSRPAASRRNQARRSLQLESLENRVVMASDLPVAVNDLFVATADQTLDVATPGIFANDADPRGSGLSAQLFSGPAHGALDFHADGSFQYEPEAGFVGLDSFVYVASDGVASTGLGAVTLRVERPDAPPVSVNDIYSASEDQPLDVAADSGVLANDTDADSVSLTANLVSGPANGAVTFNSDGSFSYTPHADFNGVDGFSYMVSDGTSESNVATVTLIVGAVNDTPVASNDEYATDEDTPLVIDPAGVLANDTDVDGDPLTASLVAGPANGTVTLNSDGSFTYTPNADFNGVDGFSYTVSDGTAESDVAVVTLNVGALNDAPVANNDEFSLDEDAPLVIDPTGVLANDTDVDGDPLTATLVDGPTNGTVTLNSDGSFTYTPNADFNGVDGFRYSINDGAAESDVAVVTLNVGALNDAPVGNNDEFSLDEDAPLVIDPAGVLANDTDVDGDSLTATLVDGPTNGIVTLNSDGSFTYTPNADFNGVDGFSYTVSDGTAESDVAVVTLNVGAVNDAPLASNDDYATDEDTPLVIDPAGVLANDTDVDGDPLTATLVDGPTNGTVTLNSDGSFTYTPQADFHGEDQFTYEATDGELPSAAATVKITVNSVAETPVVHGDAYNVGEDGVLSPPDGRGVLANDFDLEDLPLLVALADGPSHGTLDLHADGSFSYVPEVNFFGVDQFTYTAQNSGGKTSVGTVKITVQSINDAPTAADDEFQATGGQTLNVTVAGGLLANDADVEGDALQANLVRGPSHGTLALQADGSLAYTPQEDFIGVDSFTYQVNDGLADSNVAKVTLNVGAAVVETPVNVRPTANNDRFFATAGTPLVVAAPGVLGNDSDPEGAALTASLFTPPQHGTVSLQGDGSFSYAANAGFIGRDSFVYRVSDGELFSALAAATIYVRPAPTPPAVVGGTTTPGCNPAPQPVRYECEVVHHLGHRLGVIRERLIDGLMAARNARQASHCVVDAIMAANHRWC